MYTFIIVGMTGQGKSEFVKKYIAGRNCLVMDINNEYGSRTKYPGQVPINLSDDVRQARSRYTGGDFERFQDIVLGKRRTICVFEEATIFLEGRTAKKMRMILTNKMFTQNIYFLIFHDITTIPPRALRLSNYVVMYKTGDEDYQVEKKYPSLYPYFLKVKNLPDGQYVTIKRNV